MPLDTPETELALRFLAVSYLATGSQSSKNLVMLYWHMSSPHLPQLPLLLSSLAGNTRESLEDLRSILSSSYETVLYSRKYSMSWNKGQGEKGQE